MHVKAEFILETEPDTVIEAMTELIHAIFQNGENISDYALIYTRKNEEDNWKELK